MVSPVNSKIKYLARWGYSARGAIYLIIGSLAVLAAIGQGGRTTGSKGALVTLLAKPLGDVLVGLIAAGLVGYSVWRFVQAAWDVDGHGTRVKGLAIRSGLAVSAFTHLSLAVFCLSMLLGFSLGGSGSQRWTAWLLGQPFGRWAVGLVGLAVIGAGAANLIKGIGGKFKKQFDMDRMTMAWASPVCVFGLAARGLAFFLIGGFIVIAGVNFEPEKARGLSGVLSTIHRQPYGPYLLMVVAVGLFAFGVYSVLAAIYRRIG